MQKTSGKNAFVIVMQQHILEFCHELCSYIMILASIHKAVDPYSKFFNVLNNLNEYRQNLDLKERMKHSYLKKPTQMKLPVLFLYHLKMTIINLLLNQFVTYIFFPVLYTVAL